MHFLKGLERNAKKLVPQSWRKYFRASKYELLMQRRAPIDLIVHVGAHWAEDAGFYEDCGARTVLWVEADPDTHAELQKILADRSGPARHLTENALVSADAGDQLEFHRFKGDGSSSSIHKATDTLKERFPDAGESGEVLQLTTRTLPDILARHELDPTKAKRPMLVVDVQGHELSVLQGLGDGLKMFAQCKCEVSKVPLYDGGAMFEDIDAHMRKMGFSLASHRYVQVPSHGDVLYIRD
jgi:FkbM family methyltransferase